MAKKTSNKELYEKAYNVALTKEAKRLGVVKKKRLTIALTAIAVVAAAGAGYAGYSIWKGIDENKIENRLVIDPAASKDAQISDIKYNENGDATCNVTVKDTTTTGITKVVVCIGNDILTEGEEYEAKFGNAESSKTCNVTIFKDALSKHSGQIKVTPEVKKITFNVTFIDDDKAEAEKTHHFKQGMAPDPQEIEINKCATSPSAESEEGEIVSGWLVEVDGEWQPFEFTTPITQNIVLKANWVMHQQETVHFVTGDGASQIGDISVTKGTTIKNPGTPTKEGYKFAGWYKESTFENEWNFETDTVNAETWIYAKFDLTTCTVTFDPNGGKFGGVSMIVTKYPDWGTTIGTNVETELNPSRKGYKLNDDMPWVYDGNKQFIFGTTVIKSDMTVKANWEEDNVTVKFYIDGSASSIADQSVKRGFTATQPEYSEEGYTLDGWYTDSECSAENKFDFSTGIEESTTEKTKILYAKKVINKYTVTFDSNGGSVVSPIQNVEYGSTITAPAAPTRTGYTFAGWTHNGTAWDFDTATVKENITLVATWTEDTVTMTFNSNGGSTVPSQTVKKGDKLIEPEVTRTGYSIEGWYTDSGCTAANKWNFATSTVDGTVTTLYANWTINTYTVTFDSNGGSAVSAITDVEYNTTISAPTAPTRTGYTFAGWTHNGSAWNFSSDTVKENITLVATWTEDTYTVTFDSNGGSTVPSQTVKKGDKLVEPTATKDGYTLEGWYSDSGLTTKVDFSSYTVSGAATLYAKWTANKYTVTFDSNGGSAVSAITDVEYNTTISAPTAPTRTGYTFAGWTHNGTAWNFSSDTVKENITLVATWTEDTYTVTFDSNGGSTVPSQTVKKGDKLVEPTATKDGYTLEGWYSDSGLTTKVDFSSYTVSGAATLYANWTPNKYTVTFDSNGGSAVSAITDVEYNTTISAPTAPTRTGYTFAGWTHNGSAWNFSSDTVKENITLVATWTENVPDTIDINCGTNNEIATTSTTATTTATLKKDGQEITCLGTKFYEISAKSIAAGDVTIDFSTGAVTITGSPEADETFTIKVTYVYGSTTVSNTQVVKFIAA